jgi:hypothetical protein
MDAQECINLAIEALVIAANDFGNIQLMRSVGNAHRTAEQAEERAREALKLIRAHNNEIQTEFDV